VCWKRSRRRSTLSRRKRRTWRCRTWCVSGRSSATQEPRGSAESTPRVYYDIIICNRGRRTQRPAASEYALLWTVCVRWPVWFATLPEAQLGQLASAAATPPGGHDSSRRENRSVGEERIPTWYYIALLLLLIIIISLHAPYFYYNILLLLLLLRLLLLFRSRYNMCRVTGRNPVPPDRPRG